MTASAAPAAKKQHKTGRKKDEKIESLNDLWDQLLDNLKKHGLDTKPFEEDLRRERQALKDPAKHKDFKPTVAYIDQALKKFYDGLNYHPPEPWKFRVNGASFLEALSILVEGFSKKEPDACKKLCDSLHKFLSGLYSKGNAGGKPPKEDKKTRGEKSKEAEDRFEAWITLAICALKAWIVVERLGRAFGGVPAEKTEEKGVEDAREKVTKGEAAKAAVDWLHEVLTALATILWNPEDRASLREWASAMRSEKHDLHAAKDRNELRKEEILGVSDAKRKSNQKDRVDERQADRELLKTDPKKAKIAHTFAFLKALAEFLERALNTYDAWRKLSPKDLDGKVWHLEGLPDPQTDWTVAITQSATNAFEATLKGRGIAYSSDRKGTRHPEVVEETKATAGIVRKDEADVDLVFTWKPAGSESKRLPALGDAFFRGAQELEETVHETSRFELVAKASPLGQQKGKQADLLFTRRAELGEWLDFAVAVLRLAAAAWGLVPEKTRLQVEGKVLEKINPPLKKLSDSIQKRIPFVKEHLEVKLEKPKDKWLAGLDVKGGKGKFQFRLGASWDFLALVHAAIAAWDDGATKSKVPDQSPFLPQGFKLAFTTGRFGRVTLQVDQWDGRAAGDKPGKSLDEIADTLHIGRDVEWLRNFAKDYDVRLDIDMPRVAAGDASASDVNPLDQLPALELPLYAYLKRLPGDLDVPCKFTFTLGLTAKEVASYFPQVRAVLFAWDVGWSIGTMLNETQLVQDATNSLIDVLLAAFGDEDWQKRYGDYQDLVLKLHGARRISAAEEVVGLIKSAYVAADDHVKAYPRASLFWKAKVPNFTLWNHQAESMAQTAKDLLAGKQPRAYGSESSPARLMIAADLLGRDDWTRDALQRQIQDDVRKGRLHEMQGALLGFYVDPFDAHGFDGWYAAKQRAFLDKYKALYDSARQPKPSPTGTVPVTVRSVPVWYEFVKGQDHKKLVRCITFQWPDPHLVDAVEYVEAKSEWGYEIVRQRANESIRVELITQEDGLLYDWRHHLGADDGFMLAAECHHLRRELSELKNDLLPYKREATRMDGRKVSGAWLEVRVSGQGGSPTSVKRFLELDGTGRVVTILESNQLR